MLNLTVNSKRATCTMMTQILRRATRCQHHVCCQHLTTFNLYQPSAGKLGRDSATCQGWLIQFESETLLLRQWDLHCSCMECSMIGTLARRGMSVCKGAIASHQGPRCHESPPDLKRHCLSWHAARSSVSIVKTGLTRISSTQ